MKPPQIIVVACTGNLNRSPLLAAVIRARHPRLRVLSCGVGASCTPGRRAAKKTRDWAADTIQLSLEEHRTTRADDLIAAEPKLLTAALFVGFSEAHKTALTALGVPVHKVEIHKVKDPGFLPRCSPAFSAALTQVVACEESLFGNAAQREGESV